MGKSSLGRLVRSGYGIAAGVVAIGVAAAAAGAAPSALTPWSDSRNEPAVTLPATTDPSTVTEPADTTVIVATDPPASATPTTAASVPATVEVVVATTPPPTTPPAAADTVPAPPVEPPATTAATATTSATPSDNSVPTTLSLACSLLTVEGHANVSCEWSGAVPAGFARYLLLRGNHGSTGRVPFSSPDAGAHSFTDVVLAPASYTYVLVEVDSADKPLGHSNMVPIVVPQG